MNLIPFQFETAAIRVVEIEGEPWFVGSDIARALGYANASDAFTRHCKGVAKHAPLDTPGGMQQVRVIAEADVLRLVIGSKLPAADRFERWVFEQVLPAIRKTGSYAVAEVRVPQSLPEALRLAADLADKNTALVAQVAEQAPKVAALDRIETADGTFSLTDAAKLLKIKPQAFTVWLCDRSWIFRRFSTWIPYQHRLDQGVMVLKVIRRPGREFSDPERVYEQSLITAKGLAQLAKLLESFPQRSVASVAERSIATITERLR